MKSYILSIDQGTTSTRAVLFNKKGELCYIAQKEISLIYRKPSWVEVDAIAIWISATEVVNEVLIKANIDFTDIDSIGITNQRETTVVWDKKTGVPVAPAIVWQSNQTQGICDQLDQYSDVIRIKTGLPLNPYFSASKIRFILDSIPDGQKRAEAGELMAGTIDTWLLYRITNKTSYLTDISNASRTLLFNIYEKRWDSELLKLFDIPICMLPQVKSSSYNFGNALFFGTDTPVCGIAGDQQASLFGHACFEKGDIKNTYGTGCFMLLNTGDMPSTSQNGLITTIGWDLDGKTTYVLEGSVFVAGAAVQWLRDQLQLLEHVDQSEWMALDSDYNHEIVVVPAFTGLGAPYWDSLARGAIFGLERDTSKNDIARATLEAIAFQSKDVFHAMEKDAQIHIKQICVDGGASKNNYLLQFQANILNASILRPVCYENTALGACFLSGLYTGFYESQEYIKSLKKGSVVFKPTFTREEISEHYRLWKIAIRAVRHFKK